MKSLTFDQLKTMLKSMSNALFKRIGNVTNRVEAVENKVKDIKQPKTIIIKRDFPHRNGYATSDTPFEEAWAMTDAELMTSIVITTDESSYNLSASAVSVEHLQANGIKMLRIIVNDEYDGSAGELLHNEILWANSSGIGTFSRKSFITVEKEHIAALMKRSDSFELTYDDALDLKTMSETIKGGAKVGNGLEVMDDVLSVVVKSPGGQRYSLTVDDNGTLSAAEITE